MTSLRNRSGQLSLPILAILFMFGLFIAAFARHSLKTYRQMKLDVTADLVALSSARTQAQLLNSLAMTQTAMNVFLQKARAFGADVGHAQVEMKDGMENTHQLLQLLHTKFAFDVVNAGYAAARANGFHGVVIPKTPNHFRPMLKGKSIKVSFWKGILPVALTRFKDAYFVREWKPRTVRAQPIHTHVWLLQENRLVTTGKARLWLDIGAGSLFHNGGFPQPDPSFWQGLGIQCKLPHFNARLMPRQDLTS